MKIFICLFLLCVLSFGGNLSYLIALAQNATRENVIKFNNLPKFKEQEIPIKLSLNARYVLTTDSKGRHKTKSGSITTGFEYMLYDGGVSKANEKIAIHKNISKLYKSDEILNQTAFEIGQIYFNAVAIDEMIELENELSKAIKTLLDEASFWLEFEEISQSEYDVLSEILKHSLASADELEFRRFELLKQVNLLAEGELDFIAGSHIKMPDFSKKQSIKTEAKIQLNLARSYSNIEEQGKLMPKFYLKDAQGVSINSLKTSGKSKTEIFNTYLAANRPMLEFSWSLPNESSAKERELKRLEEYKSTQILNTQSMQNSKILDELSEQITALNAKLELNKSRYLFTKNELYLAINRYKKGEINIDMMVSLISLVFENSQNFIQGASELEILKMKWYFERGEKLEYQIY